jgi:hypothetical protein
MAASALAQRSTGELRLVLRDETGAPADASITIASDATGFERELTSRSGRATISQVPYGPYRIQITRPGFAGQMRRVDIGSEVPIELAITLTIQPIATQLEVASTLLNTERAGASQFLGRQFLDSRRSSLPSRGVLDLVDSQPGWLLEANGVLHPRGSEYDLQYVVDGLPLFDNRSPAFAPPLAVEDVASLNVLTAAYPPEYGRKLGGVVETAAQPLPSGWTGRLNVQGGTFGTASSFASAGYGGSRGAFLLFGEGLMTDRYLDAPVDENYTNRGSGGGGGGRFEFDLSERDRIRVAFREKRIGFQVPNDYLQQAAGQRQDRVAQETLGNISWQRVLSARALLNVRAMGRDLTSELWANAASTPIQPSQSRGFRETYLNGTLAVQQGRHQWKFGGDAVLSTIRERFGFRITAYELEGFEVFDDDTPEQFQFEERAQHREFGFFAQDQFRWKTLVVTGGVRWDAYRLRVRENAWSPRLAAAWTIPSWGLTVRGSYDRVFQTPAIENILLATSDAALPATEDAFRLPLRPSRAHFFEGGLSKTLLGRARLDASIFQRRHRNFADDEVFLNTGVSFPVTFDRATVDGVEVKFEIPRWGRINGYASYSLLNARTSLPISGGLFLDDDAAELLTSTGTLRISQDQRNTVRSRWRAALTSRFWIAAGAQYGSGLPVELEDDNRELWERQYGPEVLRRVNLGRERVRQNFSLDLSAGALLHSRERWQSTLQFDAANVTDRLNVINFAGLLSGTALQPRRAYSIRFATSW